MRFACAYLFLLSGCSFPNVAYDGSVQDATIDDTGPVDTGVVISDAGPDIIDTGPPPVTKGCKGNADCKMTCTGTLTSGCGCVAYLADSAAPFCDTTCALTGCANKMPICIDGGTCILQ